MKQLAVYQRILEIIHLGQKGGFTFEMVTERLKNSFGVQGLDPTYSIRTLQRDLNEIRDVHGIDIQFNKRTKLYEVVQDLSSPIRTKVLESFELIYTLNLQKGLENVVFFDDRKAKGSEHLHALIYAIKNKCVVSFQHHQGWQHHNTRKIRPLALKEFKNTWNLIGLNENDKMRNYGLDRISDLKILAQKFDIHLIQDIEAYYKDTFGILNDEHEPVEEIILNFTAQQGNYIKSKPIHHSQRVLVDDGNQFKISLELKINPDFIAEILSFGDAVKIEKPEKLKNKVKLVLKNMLRNLEVQDSFNDEIISMVGENKLNGMKIYDLSQVASFQKTDEEFGGLSNMKGKIFPLRVNGLLIHTSEALYQACRFPDFPEIQKAILAEASPMAAKMKAKKFRNTHTRQDFEDVKVEIMRWCLRLKLANHPQAMGSLLLRTGSREIVEISHKDKFWGAVRKKENPQMAEGENVLGLLLMDLREFYLENRGKASLLRVSPPEIPNFKLLGNPVSAVDYFKSLGK